MSSYEPETIEEWEEYTRGPAWEPVPTDMIVKGIDTPNCKLTWKPPGDGSSGRLEDEDGTEYLIEVDGKLIEIVEVMKKGE